MGGRPIATPRFVELSIFQRDVVCDSKAFFHQGWSLGLRSFRCRPCSNRTLEWCPGSPAIRRGDLESYQPVALPRPHREYRRRRCPTGSQCSDLHVNQVQTPGTEVSLRYRNPLSSATSGNLLGTPSSPAVAKQADRTDAKQHAVISWIIADILRHDRSPSVRTVVWLRKRLGRCPTEKAPFYPLVDPGRNPRQNAGEAKKPDKSPAP